MKLHTFIFISTLTLSSFLQGEVHNSLNGQLSVIPEKILVRRQNNPGQDNTGKGNTKQENSGQGNAGQDNSGQGNSGQSDSGKNNSKKESSPNDSKSETGSKKSSNGDKSNQDAKGDGKGKENSKDKGNGKDKGNENKENGDGGENEEESEYQEDPLEPESEENEEEEVVDDTDKKDFYIKIKEPSYGSLNVLNIPLGGQQKIRWEMGEKPGKTKGVAVTAVLPGAGGDNTVYHIVKNFNLGKNEVIWNTSKFMAGSKENPPLRSSNKYRLYIHDSRLRYDETKPNRARAASVQFNLYTPPDVSNRFKNSRATHLLPSLTSLIFSCLTFYIL